MVELVQNQEHVQKVLSEILNRCRHRLFISTADLKNLHIPPDVFRIRRRTESSSIVDVFRALCDKGVQIQILHSGIPSGPFLKELKKGIPENIEIRRCVRIHTKAMIADGRYMYLGSANMTGAGIGARGERRRNFEAGICTDELSMIDDVVDVLEDVFQGGRCAACDVAQCYKRLESPI